VRTRRFGDTDLEASEIGFGTWALGSTWWGDVTEDQGERLLSEALDHFLRVSASQEAHLFFCYDHSGIPATNNDLEHCFGSARYYERRTTGRRGAIPGLVVRGTVRVLAALATHTQCFLPFGLFCEDLASWHQLRKQLDYRQEGRRRQFRFRKDPEAYLAQLEATLLKPSLPT